MAQLTGQQALRLAIQHHQNGDLPRAENLYRQILLKEPKNADALHLLGLVAHQMGRNDQAVELIRRAIAIQPDFTDAYYNLGVSLQAGGHYAEAIEANRRAISLRPDYADAYRNLGVALDGNGQLDEAIAAARKAIGLNARDYEAYGNLGTFLAKKGQLGEAAAGLRRALELGGGAVAGLWLALASVHVERRDDMAAIPCYARALSLQPNSAAVYNDLGRAQIRVHGFARAAACFNKALALQPGQADALVNLGLLHRELGNLPQAETAWRAAHKADPDLAGPLAQLASLLKGRLPEADRMAVAARSDDARLSVADRASLLFGLGQVLDGRGEYASAAQSAAKANALVMEQSRQRGTTWNSAEHRLHVSRLIEGFTPELFARLADEAGLRRAADEGRWRLPVFVFGLPRSGTTLIEQVLASHSRVHGAGELRLSRELFESLPFFSNDTQDLKDSLAALDGEMLEKWRRHHLSKLTAIVERDRPGFVADRVVDKMPDSYLYLGLVALTFPGATLIQVRREPRDVAVSCWMMDFADIGWANDFEHIGERFTQYRRLMDHWHAVLPVRIHEVSYERLVEDFENESRRLVNLCGLDWEPACMDFHRTVRAVSTSTEIRQPLYRTSAGRWKNYEGILDELFQRLPREI
ncbi:MAG TPA: sulfotransferase [Tepidisphaeraceae bacterium]|jgi:tetratricopeptide (TPR) repeat protein|nr:sulfotransferase [Tepidisphaeraceae bacterium]